MSIMSKPRSDSRVLSWMLLEGTIAIANDPKCPQNDHREIYLNSTYRLIESIKYDQFARMHYTQLDSDGDMDIEPAFDKCKGKLTREQCCDKLQSVLKDVYKETATKTDKKWLVSKCTRFIKELKKAKQHEG
jgi:hypothetical protein